MKKWCLCCVPLLLCVLGALFVNRRTVRAEYYRWIDENGVMHFADSPPPQMSGEASAPPGTPSAPQRPSGATPAAASGSLPGGVIVKSNQLRSIAEVDEFGYPLVAPDQLEIRDLLERREFEALEALFEGFVRDVQADFRKENWLQDGFGAFACGDPTLLAALNEWVAARPRSASALLARGMYYGKQGWNARGGGYASETKKKRLDEMRLYLELAEPDILQALTINPKLTPGHIALLGIYKARGRCDRLRPTLDAALAVNPNSYRVRVAYMYAILPRWCGSRRTMEAFADECESHAATNQKLRTIRGVLDWDRAGLLDDSRDEDERLRLSIAALRFGPGPTLLEGLGEAYAAKDRWQDAVDSYSRALRMEPQRPDALRRRGYALARLGRTQEAIADLEFARRLEPADEQARKILTDLVEEGVTYHREAPISDALDAAEEDESTDSMDAKAVYARGVAKLKRGDDRGALSDFKAAIRMDPRDIESYRQADRIMSKRGRWNDIIAQWDDFLRLEPNNADGYHERGGAYFNEGDREGAREDLQKACDLGSQTACADYRKYFSGKP